jgi:hypothetical protein
MEIAKNPLLLEGRFIPNNIKRKRLYRKVFIAMDFGNIEPGVRMRLPHCACAKIGQMYPDETGCYMGFTDF